MDEKMDSERNAFETAMLKHGWEPNHFVVDGKGEYVYRDVAGGWKAWQVAHLTQPAQAVDGGALTSLVSAWRERENRDSLAGGEYYSGKSFAYETCADELEQAITRALGNAQAEGWRDLLDGYRGLYRAYVNTLEAARDRIRDLGGECDPLDVMERSDPALSLARERLAKYQPTPPQPEE